MLPKADRKSLLISRQHSFKHRSRPIAAGPSSFWREVDPSKYPEVLAEYQKNLAAKERLAYTGAGFAPSPGGAYVDGEVDLTDETERFGEVAAPAKPTTVLTATFEALGCLE